MLQELEQGPLVVELGPAPERQRSDSLAEQLELRAAQVDL